MTLMMVLVLNARPYRRDKTPFRTRHTRCWGRNACVGDEILGISVEHVFLAPVFFTANCLEIVRWETFFCSRQRAGDGVGWIDRFYVFSRVFPGLLTTFANVGAACFALLPSRGNTRWVLGQDFRFWTVSKETAGRRGGVW